MLIKIYQIDRSLDSEHMIFSDLDSMLKMYNRIPTEIYKCVYNGEVKAANLEEVYCAFNLNHPYGYKGRSMSVSDIVEVINEKNDSDFYYCDTVSFCNVTFKEGADK